MPGHSSIRQFLILFIAAFGTLILCGQPVFAQQQPVTLNISRNDMGINGIIRAGTWTPIRLSLTNNASETRQVTCRWMIPDSDGDTVFAERTVNLPPAIQQQVWLYGSPAYSANNNTTWDFHILDTETGELLASQLKVAIPKYLSAEESAIGIFGTGNIGLNDFMTTSVNQGFGYSRFQPYIGSHEYTDFIANLQLNNLPDRWYGLSIFNTIVWSQNGGDPNEARVRSEMLGAVREWVERGGHFIVILPAVAEPWTSSSLADMLPVDKSQMRQYEALPPSNIVGLSMNEPTPILMTAFDVQPNQDKVSIVATDKQGTPLIVSRQYGFGKVTLIGIDLASPSLRSMGLPAYQKLGIWHDVLRWQAPAYRGKFIDEQVKQGKMTRGRSPADLTAFIPNMIAMRNTTSAALLLALLLFAIYWLLAGPISYATLRYLKRPDLSWTVFGGLVVVFIVIAWSGAYFMRPTSSQINHYTLLDMTSEDDQVHAHSWLSLYMPSFASNRVAVAPDSPSGHNTLASPGFNTLSDGSGFIDTQSYVQQSGKPYAAEIPFRATTKNLEIDFYGDISAEQSGLDKPWPRIESDLEIDNLFRPTGTITHRFATPLRDIRFVYMPGRAAGSSRPARDSKVYTWRYNGVWEPGKPLTVQLPSVGANDLIKWPKKYTKRTWSKEGFLGTLIGLNAGDRFHEIDPTQKVNIPESSVIQAIELLSFYEMLPPPDFYADSLSAPRSYRRYLGRLFDLTRLIDGRRLVVIAHMDQSTLPIPLTVDEGVLPSKGWTTIRWVHTFEDQEVKTFETTKLP
ncbi:hypothetical protein [Poriferisphaera sp. WC338]|uniref:hypothetical protein n=1 Tax=Poriferisphaera sp. WC338 TaxID=3425129 RepID=UPI003D815427